MGQRMSEASVKHTPERMCVVCRNRFPKGDLERFVCPESMKELTDNGPVPDPKKQFSGRGFYVCVQDRCREIFPKMIIGLMKKRKGVSQ